VRIAGEGHVGPGPINGELRPSRLVKSISNYVRSSVVTMLRVVIIYRPLSVWTGAVIVWPSAS
jgi:hypothetical protein